MKKLAYILSLSLLSTKLYAVSAEEGKEHYEMANCSSCHIENGKYDALNNKAKNRFQLQGWVTKCNKGQGAGWKPFEEEEVVEYLNTIHYKF
jgi:cytochrome c553